MTLSHRVVGLGVLGTFLAFYFRGRSAGSVVEYIDGRYHVEAHSDPLLLIIAAAAMLLFWIVLQQNRTTESLGGASLKRRAAAFGIDSYFALFVLSPPFGFLTLLLEAARTGRFAWSFDRDYSVPTDWAIGIPGVFLFMALVFFYFAYPLTRGGQTIGCYVMRTKVTPPFGNEGRFTLRQAVRRTWYEFRGLATLLGKGSRDSEGRTWWDRETNCRVQLVQYK